MTQHRRDFIKSSIALTFISVSKVSADQPKKIGVVSSIKLKKHDEQMDCFMAGLAQKGWTETGTVKHVNVPNPKEAEGRYGGAYGIVWIKSLVNDHLPVDLIVAAGGVVSRRAASGVLSHLATSTPYVYLSGSAPQTPSVPGKYCGVILNIAALYPAARTSLVGEADAGDVWLVQNANSYYAPGELDEWRTGFSEDRDFRFFESPPTDNPLVNARAAFKAEAIKLMANNPKGIIVSPDPFFRMQAQDSTDGMNDAGVNVPICYPFKDFALRPSPADQLLKGSPMLSSNTAAEVPDTAFAQLGIQAGAVLDDPAQIKSMRWEWNTAANKGTWVPV
jgi:hypothetical protein